jgi:WD40 repeat protein
MRNLRNRIFAIFLGCAIVATLLIAVTSGFNSQYSNNRFELRFDLQSKTQNTIDFVIYSADGKYLIASEENDNRIALLSIWDIVAGSVVGKFVQPARITGIAASPNSQFLAVSLQSTEGEGMVRILSAVSGVEVSHFRTDDGASQVVYSPNGQFILTQGAWAIHLWNATTGAHINKFTISGDNPLASFSPDGRVISMSFNEGAYSLVGRICLWDTASFTQLGCSDVGIHILDMTWSPDGSHVALAGDGAIVVYNIEEKQQVKVFNLGYFTHPVAYSPDGSYLATEGNTHNLSVWDTKTWNRVADFGTCSRQGCTIRQAAFSPSGDTILIQQSDYLSKPRIEIWSVPDRFRKEK